MKKIFTLNVLILVFSLLINCHLLSQSNWDILGSSEPEKVSVHYEDTNIKLIGLEESSQMRYSKNGGSTWQILTSSTSYFRRIRSSGDSLYIIATSDAFLLLNINSGIVVNLDAEVHSWSKDFWFEFFKGQIFLSSWNTHYRYTLKGSLIVKNRYNYEGFYSLVLNNELYWIGEFFGKTYIFKRLTETEYKILNEIKSKSKVASHSANRIYVGKYVTDNFGATIDSLPILKPDEIANISASNGKAVYKIRAYNIDTLHIFNYTTLVKKIKTVSSNTYYFNNDLIYLNHGYCDREDKMIYNINTDTKAEYVYDPNVKTGYTSIEAHGNAHLICRKCSYQDELNLSSKQWDTNKYSVDYNQVKYNTDTLLTIKGDTVFASYNRGGDWVAIYVSTIKLYNIATNNGIIVLHATDSLVYTFNFFKTIEYRSLSNSDVHFFGGYKFELLPNGDVISIGAFIEILCKYRYATNEIECDNHRFYFNAFTTRYDHNTYSYDADFEWKDNKSLYKSSILSRLQDNDLEFKVIDKDTSTSDALNYHISPFGILLKFSTKQLWIKSNYNSDWVEVNIDVDFVKICSAIIDEQGILYVSTVGPGIIRYKTPFNTRKAINLNVLDGTSGDCLNHNDKEALIYKSFINEEGITALTDYQGNVRFTSPDDNYLIKPAGTSQNIQLCEIDNEIKGSLSENLIFDTTMVKSYDNCPYLRIYLPSFNLLNRCYNFSQSLVIRNEGEIPTSEQTIIKVSLNSDLQLLKYDSIQFVRKDGNDYYFRMPTMEQSETYSYNFYFKAPCEYIIGNKFCTQVSIDQIGNLCDNEKNLIYESCSELKDNFMNLLSVRYYLDTDLDCKKDQNETTINASFKINDSLFVANSNSEDIIYSTQENTVKVTPNIINTDLFTLCPAPQQYIFNDTTKYALAEFGLQAKKDCQNVGLVATVFVRRCFQTSLSINIKNTGTKILESKSIIITLDDKVEFIGASLPYQLIGSNQVKILLDAIYPLSHKFISIVIKDNCQSPLGSTYSFSYKFEGIESQCSPSPLSGTWTVNSVGAYDPNDKTVIVNGTINKSTFFYGDSIEYLIRFQNTGTDTAFNVIIEDDLSAAFDVSKLRPITASHPYIWSFRNNKIKVQFPNIMLVDSFTNEPLSHGFIKFAINLKPTASLGSSIKNKAAIFFDFNDPIITNETKTEVKKDIVNVKHENNLLVIDLSPNPSYDFLSINIEKDMDDQIGIYNMQGAKVFVPIFGTTIDVRNLDSGTYIVKLTKRDATYIGRFVKI